ncbi:MAG: ABC transporter ATP-binding protein [Clostridia bacterium]|nr:ABC transporter ATP-binding protein [Clostridia bacterium]
MMKKFIHIISNHLLMVKYFLRFAPVYFIVNFLFCIYVSFIDMLTGAYSVKYIFNGLSEGKSFKELFLFLGFVSLAMIVRHILGAVSAEYLSATAWVKLKAGMKKLVFEQARKMDLVYYETPKFYTDFVWAAAQSDEKMGEMYNSWCVFVARLSDLIFFGGFMLANDVVLMLFAAVMIVIRFGLNSIIVKLRYKMHIEAKPHERERDYITRVFYLAEYAKEIRLSNMHKTLFKRLKDTMDRIWEINDKTGKKITVLWTVAALSTEGFLDFFIYLYLCFKTLVTKTLKFGGLASLTGAVWNFAYRAGEFINVLTDMGEQSLYVDNFRAFLAYKPEIECQDGMDAPDKPSVISMKNVSFKYEGTDKYSLKNINLDIKPYEKIAIVGYNGAGKSTLVKLIMRLYDVTEGEISMNGIDIRKYSTDSYRSVFGSVFQDYKVFAGTVAENVEMNFINDSRRKDIVKALQQSGFEDKLAKLGKGIDTPLTREFSEEGINLSGGEEQKIAIARIFAKKCSCVILDEPSSALDPISEYKLNQTMLTLSEHKTVIFISHRLSTTCMADRIIMLENGEIIEQGTHDELMSMNGKYAEMFNKQAEKYRVA